MITIIYTLGACVPVLHPATDDMNFEMDVCEAYEAVSVQKQEDFQDHHYEFVTFK